MTTLQPCGTPGAYRRHRYRSEDACPACKQAAAAYERWRTAGRPEDGPPPPRRREWTEEERQANRDNILRPRQAHIAKAAGRREDYWWLRNEMGLTRVQAAERLGVTERTAWRYEAAVRQSVAA